MSVWPARRQMQRSKPCEEAGPGDVGNHGKPNARHQTWGWCIEAISERWWLGDGLWQLGFTWLYHLNISESYISIENHWKGGMPVMSPLSPTATPQAWKVLPWLKPSRRCCEKPRPIDPSLLPGTEIDQRHIHNAQGRANGELVCHCLLPQSSTLHDALNLWLYTPGESECY